MKIAIESFQSLKDKRKCNCSRSQCLKLYCECFAQGLSCENCNCENCKNNIAHTLERDEAVRSILSKNPNAFNSKSITGKRTILKGCNCKRSNCLKNYCECFEAKVSCTSNCKCKGCKNSADAIYQVPKQHEPVLREKNTIAEIAKGPHTRYNINENISSIPIVLNNDPMGETKVHQAPLVLEKLVTHQMAEISCGCMLMQLEHSIENRKPKVEQEKIVLEEFSKCLEHILVSIARNRVLSQSDHIIINDCGEEDIAIIQDGLYSMEKDKENTDSLMGERNVDCEDYPHLQYEDQLIPSIMVYNNDENTDFTKSSSQVTFCQNSTDQFIENYQTVSNATDLSTNADTSFTSNQLMNSKPEASCFTSSFDYPTEISQRSLYTDSFTDNSNCIPEQQSLGNFVQPVPETIGKEQYADDSAQSSCTPLDLAVCSDSYDSSMPYVTQSSEFNQINPDMYKNMQFSQYNYDEANRQHYWPSINEGENAVANLLYQPGYESVTNNINDSEQSNQYIQGSYSPIQMNEIGNFTDNYNYPIGNSDCQSNSDHLGNKEQMTYLPSQHTAFDFLLHKDNCQTVINFDNVNNQTDQANYFITSEETNSNYTQV